MSILFLLSISAIIAIAVLVRKNKTLMYFVIASGLAIATAFLVLLNRAIKYTM